MLRQAFFTEGHTSEYAAMDDSNIMTTDYAMGIENGALVAADVRGECQTNKNMK